MKILSRLVHQASPSLPLTFCGLSRGTVVKACVVRAFLVVSFVCTASAADPAAAGRPLASGSVVKGVGFSIPSYPLPKPEQQTAYFRDMKALGATWIRFDIPWNAVQPESAEKYRWTTYDTLVDNALAAGLQIDAVTTFTPAWARAAAAPADASAPPKSPELYAAYAAAVVQHYAGKLASVEIWNEPNIYQFWKPVPDASQYVPMLKAAYTAIKAVNPKLTVLNAGLSASYDDNKTHHYIDQRTYLTQMYALGAKDYFDAFAFHPYSYPIPPDTYETYSAWSTMADTPKNLRAIMAANGDGNKPIWITEYGAPTDGPEAEGATCESFIFTGRRKVDECLQATILSQAIQKTKRDPSFGPLFLYSYIDRGISAKSQENFYGVVKFDGAHKQSYEAVKKAIAQ
jgi:hypothetical protein